MEVVQEGPHTLSGNAPAASCSWLSQGGVRCSYLPLAGLAEAILGTVEHLCMRYCLGVSLVLLEQPPFQLQALLHCRSGLKSVGHSLLFLLNTQVQQVSRLDEGRK